MSERVLLAIFDHEEDLIASIGALREREYQIIDAYTPYAVHGLDKAMGLKPSRLNWVCFICGMVGVLGMLWFEHWSASIDWPLDVGGKPWNSLPSDVPVSFEAAVFLGGFGSVFALFGVSRLFPGKRPEFAYPRGTDDRFVLVIDQADSTFDLGAVTVLLNEFHVLETEERLTSHTGAL